MSTFVLIRHGATNDVGKILSGTRKGVLLNEEGLRQASELAYTFSSFTIDYVYSSPLERALETARPIAAAVGADVSSAEEFGELEFGKWTGKTFAELDGDTDWRHFNSCRSICRAPGGESLGDARRRVMPFLHILSQRHPGERVIAVTHADIIKTIVLSCLGASLDHLHHFRIDTASVTIVEFDGRNAQLAALNLCPTVVASRLHPSLAG
jgi:probable phosphoglycerate mutase